MLIVRVLQLVSAGDKAEVVLGKNLFDAYLITRILH